MKPRRSFWRASTCSVGFTLTELGYTLMELLVAAVIAGVVLSAAFGWLWGIAALAKGADEKAQALSIVSAVSRTVAADVRASLSVTEPPAGRDPAGSLALAHDGVNEAPESVLLVWDASRKVLWRNGPATYVADHVTRFHVKFRLSGGAIRDGSSMAAADWSSIRSVDVDIAVSLESATVERRILVTVGSA